MDRLRSSKKIVIAGLVLLFAASAQAKVINVLTWWGYLSDKKIVDAVESTCNVKLSVDEYYSNPDFLRRLNNQNSTYDLLIFSNTVYGLVKDQIKDKGIPLSGLVDQYDPLIRKKFRNSKKPKNIGLFVLSYSGFLWNTKQIQLNETDKIENIFDKAKNKTIALIDDHVEVNRLLNAGGVGNGSALKRIQSLSKSKKTLVTNTSDALLNKDDFAFSFTWSGDAIKKEHDSKGKFKFLLHPKLSHVSYDLLASVSKNKSAACVAKYIGGKKFLSSIEDETFYVSPYYRKNPPSELKKLRGRIGDLHWLESSDPQTYKTQASEWKLVKLKLMRKK